MMAEMPPTVSSQSGTGGPPAGRNTVFTTTTVTTHSSTRQGLSLDRALLASIPGILSIVAIVFAFIAMISISASLPSHKSLLVFTQGTPAPFEFHEFATVTSWISLVIFTTIALLRVYKLLSIRSIVIKFIMIGHSAVWALFTLISSAVILDYLINNEDYIARVNKSLPRNYRLDIAGCRASGAFGILESLTLFGITVALILDVLGIRRENDIFQ